MIITSAKKKALSLLPTTNKTHSIIMNGRGRGNGRDDRYDGEDNSRINNKHSSEECGHQKAHIRITGVIRVSFQRIRRADQSTTAGHKTTISYVEATGASKDATRNRSTRRPPCRGSRSKMIDSKQQDLPRREDRQSLTDYKYQSPLLRQSIRNDRL